MITHKHLYAWDVMMGSYKYWINWQQETAQKEKAPDNAIYKAIDGTWVTADRLGKEHHFWAEYKRLFS